MLNGRAGKAIEDKKTMSCCSYFNKNSHIGSDFISYYIIKYSYLFCVIALL